jgi:hypothetical protein
MPLVAFAALAWLVRPEILGPTVWRLSDAGHQCLSFARQRPASETLDADNEVEDAFGYHWLK